MNTWIASGAVAFSVGACLVLHGQTPPSSPGWPQWRGPSREATIAPSDVPAVWPDAYTPRWKVDVGEGYSSPITAGGRIFVHSRQDPRELVTAIDAKTGAVIWRQEYAAAFNKNGYAASMGKGPNATPLLAGTRLFTLGASGHLHVWDAAKGTPLWTRDFSDRVDTSKLFCGTSASPMLVDGSVIVQVGSDVRGGSLVALDPATGATKWEWTGDGPGYATPVLINVGGRSQVVIVTNTSIVGIDPANGQTFWTIPFADAWHENIVTPVWTGTSLIMSGIRQGTRAFRFSGTTASAPAEIWKNTDVTMYMSSPVFADGVLYALNAKRKGQFVAIDAETGAIRWATEGREGDHASLLVAPKHVLFLTSTGTLVVARRSAAGFEAERKYDIATSATWATPILMGGDVIVRDATSVSRLSGVR